MFKAEQDELAYRFFVTESLRLQGENKYITETYLKLIQPKKSKDERSGDEIAMDVISKIGLRGKSV